MIVFTLPKPPSTNRLYKRLLVRNKAGHMRRPRTKEYEKWRELAGWMIIEQRSKQDKKIEGNYKMTFTLEPCGLDLGNAEKACSDLLQSMGIIDNDKFAREINMRWGEVKGCRIELEAVS